MPCYKEYPCHRISKEVMMYDVLFGYVYTILGVYTFDSNTEKPVQAKYLDGRFSVGIRQSFLYLNSLQNSHKNYFVAKLSSIIILLNPKEGTVSIVFVILNPKDL